MSRRRGTASLVASPVLVGAVTVLMVIIAVFIAYNANQGLPFVPTYDVQAELPSGAKLVEGNEVRVGGFRVGVVSEIKPKIVEVNGRRRAIALVDMKLDKTVEPLAVDTEARVRPRSALGLKYLQLTPGRSRRTYEAGATIPLANSSEPLDLEDVFSTFDEPTRRNTQDATVGFGDALAGRGPALNTTIGALNPFFRHLTPVMRLLSEPGTELDQFFRQLSALTAQVAPVAGIQADLFTNMATTFEAISSDPAALQATIEKSPPTLDTAIRSFRVQRPFLSELAVLSRNLRPAVQELPRSLPRLNAALRTGLPILPRTVGLSERFRGALAELEDLFENPNTLLTLRDLRTALTVTRPAVEFIAPYQTVCNYFNYFFGELSEHWSQTVSGGTVQNQGVKLANLVQPNSIANSESSRPWDVPPGVDPVGARDALNMPLGRLFGQPYQPAIDAQGNADCQNGQNGYPLRLAATSRYGPGTLPDGTPTGGNAPVADPNTPGLAGGTYKSRELGIGNLSDVP